MRSALLSGPLSRSELAAQLGHQGVSGRLNRLLKALLASGQVAYTIPEKPGSRLQKYRLVNPSEPR